MLVCSPFIIGVMNQSSGSTTDLQLHHNFRWVLCANHMEPVQGFLARYLRRRLLDAEVRHDSDVSAMDDIIDWLPQVWQHINRLLETHGGSDVTVGQQLFAVFVNIDVFRRRRSLQAKATSYILVHILCFVFF